MARRFTLSDWIDWRQPGGAVSAVAHVGLIVVGVLAFNSAKSFQTQSESSPVDIVSEQQFNEMMKGSEKGVKTSEVQERADRTAEIRKQNDPGDAKHDVPAEPPKAEVKADPPPPPPPPPPVAPPLPPARPQLAAVTPPPPRVVPDLRTRTPAPPEPDEEEEGEPIKRAAPKPPEPKKPEPKPPEPDQLQRLLEQKQREEAVAKAAEQKRIEDQKRKAEADAKAKAEADAKRKAEADAKAKADREKRQQEARDKAAREKAEADKLEAAQRAVLERSREAPAATGATSANPQRQANLGTQGATGRRLSPAEIGQLRSALTEQMQRCFYAPGIAGPKTRPRLDMTLGRNGEILATPRVTNSSSEPGFQPYADAIARAARGCGPYRIPARFADAYESWKEISISMDFSEW
jgi:colicin import membrane protein